MSRKWEDNGYKTPMARVRGLGSSRSAVPGWVRLRMTAIANVPLVAWFVWFAVQSIGASHAEFTALLGHPVNAVMMILFIVSVFWHAVLGSREIVEDYIHLEWFKAVKLIGMYLFFFAAAVTAIFCVLKVTFGG
ncbi:MAG: succinate dehydrogenase, hydrophobic membrane anchor protein [Alphaproteobacteria bacterium]|nr:succinate dehydrogenase, hydrophobic membrane anchor protein [Alphaproteobacteria bacterium]